MHYLFSTILKKNNMFNVLVSKKYFVIIGFQTTDC